MSGFATCTATAPHAVPSYGQWRAAAYDSTAPRAYTSAAGVTFGCLLACSGGIQRTVPMLMPLCDRDSFAASMNAPSPKSMIVRASLPMMTFWGFRSR